MKTWPKPQFESTDWELHGLESMASGFFQLDRLHLSHRGYEQDHVGPMTRELFRRDPAVVVILHDPSADAVVMVEQFRVGAACSGLDDSPWMVEWVAGIRDPGEAPEDTARREVFEETGIELTGPCERLFTYYPSPGGSTEVIDVFYATCDATGLASHRSQASEHEDLKIHVVALDSALDALATGRVNNAATIIGLQWLAMRQKAHRGA